MSFGGDVYRTYLNYGDLLPRRVRRVVSGLLVMLVLFDAPLVTGWMVEAAKVEAAQMQRVLQRALKSAVTPHPMPPVAPDSHPLSSAPR